MKVRSINASEQFGPLQARGKTIKTGFHKIPKETEFISMDGLVGDVRATFDGNRDRAVLLYQADAYEYWRTELNRELPYGILGDNLTFSGPGDDSFRIGDQLRIGSAVLEINQSRLPCFKIGARLEDPSFPVRYMKANKLGFFCSVVEEGEVRVGDEIVIHRKTTDSSPITVPEFTRVVALETDDVEGLERLIASNHVPGTWRVKAERLLRMARGESAEWASFQPFTVVSKEPSNRSGSVASLALEARSEAQLPHADAGQFVTLRLPISRHGEGIVRTYTISRSEPGRYYIDVKREGGGPDVPSGVGSTYLHDSVEVGDQIEALAARGHFVVEPSHRPLVLCSAGIGLTPMLAMLAEQATSADCREVHFVHGARCGDDLVQRDRVRQLIDGSDRLHHYLTLSCPSPNDLATGDVDAIGRMTADTLRKVCPDLNADFYICGPTGFIRDIVTGLVDLGVPKDQINYEYFGASESLFPEDDQPGDPVNDENGDPILVTFLQSGVTTPWTDRDTSLLQLARRVRLAPLASCETGVCNTCKSPLRAGAVNYTTELSTEPKENEVLTCSAVPRKSVIIDQ